MASGMNGQQFQFNGYLPVDNLERKKAIRELENNASKNNCTQIFIETPYRNNQLIKEIVQTCKETTLLCVAVDITAPTETIQTKTIKQWKAINIDFHKRLAIFLISAG
jgi:16S rRNA (cytidine1402-2'-O)-methyltransferase